MDGLECSEIKKSELEFSGRTDAEYYQKKFLQYQNIIEAHNILPLSKVADFLIGPFGSAYDTSLYVEQSNYRYIRGQDVKPFLLQDTSPRYMEERDFNRLNKYALATNDILISVVGTLGNACIIQEHEVPAIFSCKSTAVKAKHINPFYLLSYLNSKYGRSLLLRKERGAIQKGLNLDDLKSLDIPLFSDSLYKSAELCIKKSLDFIQRAKQCYADAEKRLEATIIPTLSLSCSNTSIKSLKESFLHSGRLDAEYYPAEIPYYQATGDSRYISPYKRDFSQNIAYRLNYTDIKYHLYEVYKHGMKIIADRYPRFIVDDFYSLNLSFKETASEEFSLEGGFSGKFVCTVKCASAETLTATIMCTDKSYRTKVDKGYAPINVSVDYSAILMAIVQEIEDWQFVLTEASLIERFYEKLFNAISDAFFSEINNAKSSIPEKGNKRFLKVFDAMLAFCARALNAIKASCLNSEFGAEHKLLSQMPITNFLQSIEGGKEMTLADKEKAYLWFISFVYRLRNALFHEIIDPLNDEWQVIFKNSYHVLKQVVDQNIWRLKQLKLLPSASQAAAEEDYNREPPPDIDWPTDEEAKFTWFYYEMLKLNKDGARVLLKGKIDFAEHHYETECTVRWNESLSETAIKNASITSVVDSQEKELAAAI